MVLNPVSLVSLRALYAKELSFLNSIKVECDSCERFHKRTKHCDKWNQQVPEASRPTGCPEWQYDNIPF